MVTLDRYTHFISKLECGGPADECGLELGDCVLEVHSFALSGLSHSGAVSVFAQFDSSERYVTNPPCPSPKLAVAP